MTDEERWAIELGAVTKFLKQKRTAQLFDVLWQLTKIMKEKNRLEMFPYFRDYMRLVFSSCTDSELRSYKIMLQLLADDIRLQDDYRDSGSKSMNEEFERLMRENF